MKMNWEPFLNRDFSWLEFNSRVLDEALDKRNPLLERIRFLGIFQSNLDEYYMKRIGSIYSSHRIRFREHLFPLIEKAHDCYRNDLVPALKQEGIELLEFHRLENEEKTRAVQYYEKNVFPVLTPLAVDPGHPFPFLSNLSLSLGVMLRQADRDEDEVFARVKVPQNFPAWIRIDEGKTAKKARFVSLVSLITSQMSSLFHGMEIVQVTPFRVTRNINVERDEEDADDLLEMIEEEIRERKFADCVRLEHGPHADQRLMQFLKDELQLDDDQVFELPGALDYTQLKTLVELPRSELKFEVWNPITPNSFATDQEQNIFQNIRIQDQLVHHPFESFSNTVEKFIRVAVDDSRVMAIKMTLYRTGADSPFVPLLIRAAENGKNVVCVVEVKARGDEEKNVQVAQMLENAGVHVVYGVVGLKTHCKLALVVRKETEGVRCYAHIGTGNYHTTTAKLYTDFGLFTAKPEITDDVVNVFHYLTGRSLKRDYKKLLVAPLTMKSEFLKRIQREIQIAKKGNQTRIIAKMNQLEDRDVILALYEASKAGVPVDLIVRGFCCLRPGVKGESENIRVISVIGRFLEHSRVFYFQNGKADPLAGDFFIGSADWMSRNLESRVEVVAPLEDKHCKEKVWDVLQTLLLDQRQAWDLSSTGRYVRRKSREVKKDMGSHAQFMRKAKQRV